jgi:DNA-binding NarL/FixJ family response regulator
MFMVKRQANSVTNCNVQLPLLPLGSDHWRAIFEHLRLSPMQVEVTTLLLRGAARKQIADALDIAEPTIKTYLDRIYARTGTTDPMQLAMRVLAVSHEVKPDVECRPKG